MRCPVQDLVGDFLASACVDTFGHRLHRNAVINRADADAKITANAFIIDDFETPFAIDGIRDRLVRRILTNDVAAAALDAQILVDRFSAGCTMLCEYTMIAAPGASAATTTAAKSALCVESKASQWSKCLTV